MRAETAAEALRDAFGPALPRRAVCLGLGGLRSPNSQLQLLLFEAMTVLLDVRRLLRSSASDRRQLAEPAVVFDPAFIEEDRIFLAERGFDVRTDEVRSSSDYRV